MRERHLPGAPTSRAWRSAPYAKCRTARRRHGYADARLGYRWGTAPAFHSRRKQLAARHVRDEIYRAACVAMAPFDALRSCAPPLVGGPRQSKTNERKTVPHGSTSWRRLCRCVGAPSVCLPESFRGGCSFGVGKPISPAIISMCTNFRFCSVPSDGRFLSLRFASQLHDLQVSFSLSRRKVSSKRRADATIEYANRVTAIRR